MDDRSPGLRAYRLVLASRLRSQVTYRASFALDATTSLVSALAEFGEVYVVFHNIPTLGGLDWPAALLVFGLARLGFDIANTVAGQLDTIPQYIRAGTLEAMMLRPQPLLAQVMTSDVVLRRFGGAVVAGGSLVAALALNRIDWTPAHTALLLVTPLSAAVIFASLFLVAGALQFWLVDAQEVTSAFVYAAPYVANFSPAVFAVPLRLTFAFVIPAAFTAYLPAAVILGLPGPAWLPAWLGWSCPAVAVLAGAAALLLWRTGVRHYTGAGG